MTWIKICGITNLEDAQTAVDAGADALGFVFYPKSPRHTNAGTVKAICSKIPVEIEKVGVFVNQAQEFPELTAIQMHFTGEEKTFPGTPLKKYLAMSPGDSVVNESIDAVFLDSGTPDQPGGTGKTFDWEASRPLVQDLGKKYRVVVAGGLTPANVAEAIRILKPWGVDVSSGVEATPGKKDPQKVRDFINAVRQVEVSV
ncbi:MAG TPA: phosphoribosylanthranilate isomerase [Terriglobales bacterium]|jgi:phosphoribosylanthranilate isomerase|nr:phosphoribosylanthranilate isomerase [Terriglobales bacterium]